ncbi:MAG: chromosome segregation protein SMC [Huintestinicola sp.]
MYLKSLELQGFKSFPDKISLDFGKGITAVVGPNGSGKSNIGDAVRWVLGEQSSKTLRGSKMEDVIFAGTQLRRPVGCASVTLNIVNDKGLLNIDAPEVSVTRKLYRSGESEYMINGAQVRLKDVSELFMDTGLGRDGYSIIGQGRVAEIVSSKSGERRDIFEEAAGISKFRYRKAEAERRLSQAEDNILRLTDIVSELEGRIEPLRKQAEKAEQFTVLASERKSLEITSWMQELSELRKRANELDEKLLINTAEYENAVKESDRLEEEQRVITKDMAVGNILIERLRNDILEAERANTTLHADIAVFRNDISHCEDAIAELEKQMSEAAVSSDENRRLTEEKLAEIKRTEDEIEAARKEYEAASAEFSDAVTDQDGFEKAVSDHSAELNRLYIRRSELSFAITSAEKTAEEIKEQRENTVRLLENADSERERLEKEKKEISEGLALLDEKKSEQQNRINGLTRLFSSKKEKLSASEKAQNEFILSVREKEQKIRLLRDLENSMEGFGNAVKQVLKAGKSGRIGGIIGSVAQLITVEPEYGVAIETALGAAMQNVVTENEDTAKRCIRMLKEMNAGRATFLPVTSVKGNRLSENGLESCMGFVALGSDIVKYDPKFKGIIDSLLGRTVIAEDIDCAAAISKKYGYRFRTVTLDGQVVNAGGSFTGGSANRSSGVITRKNEIERLETELNRQNAELAGAKEKYSTLKAETDKMQIDIEAANDEIRRIEQDKIRFEAEAGRIEQVAAQSEENLKNAKDNISRLEKRSKENAEAAEKASAELEQLLKDIEKSEQQSSEDSELREKLREHREELSVRMSEIKIHCTELEKDIYAARESIRMLEERSRSIGDGSVKSALAIEEQKKTIAERLAQIEEREKALENAGDKTKQINEEIAKTQAENLEKERLMNEIRSKIREASNVREQLGAEKTRLEERRSSVTASEDKITADMAEQYELYPSEAERLMIPDADRSEIISRLAAVKQKIRSLGNVNLSAIEEYKEVSERYSFMSGQLDDINRSKKELEKLIDELTKQMREASRRLEFEQAAFIRDRIKELRGEK